MGTTTNGQICFGILIDEGFEFPWDDEKYECELEEWWERVQEYNPPFDPYADTKSGYKDGIKQGDPVIDEYRKHRREWLENNLPPVELVNYCSCDCGMYILAIPSSVLEASRGFPKKISSETLKVDEKAVQELIAFCDDYGIKYDAEPAWYLSSYWG